MWSPICINTSNSCALSLGDGADKDGSSKEQESSTQLNDSEEIKDMKRKINAKGELIRISIIAIPVIIIICIVTQLCITDCNYFCKAMISLAGGLSLIYFVISFKDTIKSKVLVALYSFIILFNVMTILFLIASA